MQEPENDPNDSLDNILLTPAEPVDSLMFRWYLKRVLNREAIEGGAIEKR